MKIAFSRVVALTALAVYSVCGVANADLISEFQSNPPGTDPTTQTFELTGLANANFNLWLLSLESDGFNGAIDRVTNVTGAYDANGIATVTVSDLENPSFTVLLVEGFTGALNQDLDTNNDGILDLTPWATFHDGLGVPDSVADASTQYAAQLGGVDSVYTGAEPELLFRERTTGNWIAVNFLANGDPGNIFGVDGTAYNITDFDADPRVLTFGSFNPAFAIPEPASAGIMLLTVAGIAGIRRRR